MFIQIDFPSCVLWLPLSFPVSSFSPVSGVLFGFEVATYERRLAVLYMLSTVLWLSRSFIFLNKIVLPTL